MRVIVAGLLWVVGATAGYGDPAEGRPRPDERAMHLWVNASRVSPESFVDQYRAGGCGLEDFTAAQRAPRPPLAWSDDLAAAARAHTEDMAAEGFVGHPSSDGTPWADRLERYYSSGTIGENVASSGGGPERVVLSVWMCSPPHRGNVLGEWDELGAAAVSGFYTLDFGQRGVGVPALSVAAQDPVDPVDEVTVRAVWSAGAPPDTMDLLLDGEALPFALGAGAPARGVYEVTLPTDARCHRWWVRATQAGETLRYPETGSLGWGDCAWDDTEARWVAEQEGSLSEGDAACGCATGRGGGGGAILLLLTLRSRSTRRRGRPQLRRRHGVRRVHGPPRSPAIRVRLRRSSSSPGRPRRP